LPADATSDLDFCQRAGGEGFRPNAAGSSRMRAVTGIAAALVATLLCGVLIALGLRRFMSAQSSAGLTPPALVRLGSAVGLVIIASMLLAVWWATLSQLH
jgi:hypothetical protein